MGEPDAGAVFKRALYKTCGMVGAGLPFEHPAIVQRDIVL